MNRTSRSDGGPSLALGRAEAAALRAAVGTGRRSPFRPWTIEEAVAAADVIADDVDLERWFVRIGVALDLLAAVGPRSRLALRRRIGVSAERMEFAEIAWELLEPSFRFEVARTAVRIAMARRIGGIR